MNNEQIPERATRSQLIVGGQGHRTELDREQDVWYAVAELAKGKTYREIAQALSEKKGYHIAFQQVYKDVQEVLIEWKRENMENIDAYIRASGSYQEGTGKSGSYGMWNHPRGHVWNVFVRPASS